MKAKEIRNLARKSVGVYISAKAMELKLTIKLIQLLDSDIAEIGDFNRFSSPDKILAFAGLSPPKGESFQYFS